jgi:ABC-type Mn2+/Zn2+ transport system ATPase subunit
VEPNSGDSNPLPREAVISVENLAVGYRGGAVLHDVTWSVGEGEFWCVVGPNGSGKSTLLRAILGGLRPTTGTARLRADLRSRERVGFVPQRCDLNPSLNTTVREFVLLGLTGVATTRDERDARLGEALTRTGLGDLAARSYWSLSGGRRQRALVARALVRRPRLVVADEPTNGLDPAAEDDLLETLAKLGRDEGATVVFVTHELDIARRFATHVALVHDGRVATGRPEEMLGRDALDRAFRRYA